jgi:serine/threonine-protein kinase
VVASLSASALALLIVLLAVSAWYNVQITRAKAESDLFLAQAEQAVNELFIEVSENTLLNQPGMQPLREKLLRRALVYYRRFLQERGNDPALQDQLAQTHFRIGVITEAIDSREKAIESYAQARAMQLALVEQTPQDVGRLEALGKTHNALGAAQQRLRRYEDAREAYKDAVDVRIRLTKLEPGVAEHQRTLANSYMNLGLLAQELGDAVEARRQFDVAQGQRRKYLDAGQENLAIRADLGKGHYNLAILAQAEGDFDAFGREMSSAVEQFERIEQQAPDNLDNQYRLAVCYRLMGPAEATVEQALATLEKALARLEPLARANPTVDDYQFELAGLHLTRGEVYGGADDSPQALRSFQRACDVLQPLADNSPTSIRYRRELAVALRALAVELALSGRPGEARAPLEASRRYLEQLVADHGDESDFRTQLDETLAVLAQLDAAPASGDHETPRP